MARLDRRLKPECPTEAQASANVHLSQLLTAQEGTKLTEGGRNKCGMLRRARTGGRGFRLCASAYSEPLNILMVVLGGACHRVRNVANLMLIRAHARERSEISGAIGARRKPAGE